MDEVRIEHRRGQIYDPDDRTITPQEAIHVTMPETLVRSQRDIIDRRIARHVFGRVLSQRDLEAFIHSAMPVREKGQEFVKFTYKNPDDLDGVGKRVVEIRPDRPAGSNGRVFMFDYITPGPVQGPQRAA